MTDACKQEPLAYKDCKDFAMDLVPGDKLLFKVRLRLRTRAPGPNPITYPCA